MPNLAYYLNFVANGALRMPSIAAPLPDDIEIYLVLDDFGERLGRAWRETDEERADRETVITDLMEGLYSNPVRVVAFNTAENWSHDVSEDIASEIALRFALEGRGPPPYLESFLERHGGRQSAQLTLPLRGAACHAHRILPRSPARAGRVGSYPTADRAV